jgi:hypothetical protein
MTSDELATIMDYHLLPQVVYSTGLTNGTKFLTQQGENVSVLHYGNNIYINSAQLLQTDILIANGVVQVIDNVLNPQGPGAQPNPALNTQVPAFASASAVGYLPYASDLPCTVSCPVPTTSKSSAKVTSSATAHATGAGASTTSHFTSSSKGLGAAVARETGFGVAGFMVALGGAVLMI